MVDKPSATDRLYAALKAEIKSGGFVPGEPIAAAGIAKRFATSVIPVREALYRLAGERWVEVRHPNGFYAARISEIGLRDLYQWEVTLLLQALEQQAAPHGDILDHVGIDGGHPLFAGLETLFVALAETARNAELRSALHDTVDRLHPIRLVKAQLAEPWAAECERLIDPWRHGNPRQFRRALLRYHQHRVTLVPALVERACRHRTGPSP